MFSWIFSGGLRDYKALCRSVGWLVGWSVGWSVGRLVGHSLGRYCPPYYCPCPTPNTCAGLCIRTCFYLSAFSLVTHLNDFANEGIWDNSSFSSALELMIYEQ